VAPGRAPRLRELAVEGSRWREAPISSSALRAIGSTERSPESEWLATIYYELGRADVARPMPRALGHSRRGAADRLFLRRLSPGDAYELTGDHREAVRVWERAAEHCPRCPLLARLERAYGRGRPSRIIALYRVAVERAPDDLALAVAAACSSS